MSTEPKIPEESVESESRDTETSSVEVDWNGAESAVSDLSAHEDSDSSDSHGDSADRSADFSDSYLDDDEQFEASSDEILHQDESAIIVQQDEAVVSWDIQGLYDESGKVRSKRSLRNNPPMLVVSDSLGENATFVLTKELSGVLARHFDNTYRAYYGIRPKDELTFKEKMGEAKTGIQRNMGKVIIIGGILLGLLIFGLVF